MNAVQHAAKGWGRVGSKIAASTGAVVIVAVTPPGSETGRLAAIRVMTIQKKRGPRFRLSGSGTETRTSTMSADAATTMTSARKPDGIEGNATAGRIRETAVRTGAETKGGPALGGPPFAR